VAFLLTYPYHAYGSIHYLWFWLFFLLLLAIRTTSAVVFCKNSEEVGSGCSLMFIGSREKSGQRQTDRLHAIASLSLPVAYVTSFSPSQQQRLQPGSKNFFFSCCGLSGILPCLQTHFMHRSMKENSTKSNNIMHFFRGFRVRNLERHAFSNDLQS
jgi:hypothetical protein